MCVSIYFWKKESSCNWTDTILFHKCFSGSVWKNFFRPSQDPKCAGQNYVTDMLCLTALKAGLPVAVRQLFSVIAVAASEIVTVISSNSSFISFWRSFRGIFWEVLWTLKLTQIVNSLNRINRCVKFRKRNRLNTDVTFVVFFAALWTFWPLIR